MILAHRCWLCADLATQGPYFDFYACDLHAFWIPGEEAS